MKIFFEIQKSVSARLMMVGEGPEREPAERLCEELGIAENNLFLMLAALGLSAEWFGARLLPIGTLYDPFIARGLDALNYACYQDARFMLVGTPSGISLAPEGGAHQSIGTPLIGIGQPGLTYFEPTYADELAVIMQWGFHYMQADDGGSVYLRLSTRPLPQLERDLSDDLVEGIISGGYWRVKPSVSTSLVLVYCGVVAPEVEKAVQEISDDEPETAVLAITSPDRLYVDWQKAKGMELDRLGLCQSLIEEILDLFRWISLFFCRPWQDETPALALPARCPRCVAPSRHLACAEKKQVFGRAD